MLVGGRLPVFEPQTTSHDKHTNRRFLSPHRMLLPSSQDEGAAHLGSWKARVMGGPEKRGQRDGRGAFVTILCFCGDSQYEVSPDLGEEPQDPSN